MKHHLQSLQLFQSTAAIHTERLLAFLKSPGTHAAAATHPHWQRDQGRKNSGDDTPVQGKELRFRHLNNHFTKDIWQAMYWDVEFLTYARIF